MKHERTPRSAVPRSKSSTAQRKPVQEGSAQLDLRKLREQYLSDLSVFVDHYMRTPGFLAALRLYVVARTQRQALSRWRPFASFGLQRARG